MHNYYYLYIVFCCSNTGIYIIVYVITSITGKVHG